MALRYYSLAKGAQKQSVIEGSSTGLAGAGVEIAIELTDIPDRAEFNRLVEEIRNFMLEDSWPPA